MVDSPEVPQTLSKWRHYKGKTYVVYATATHTETMETLVLYSSEDDHTQAWARPLSMWHEHVDSADYSYSGPRFTKVS